MIDNPLDENRYPIYGVFGRKQQTAVEWLISQISLEDYKVVIDKAKQIEKEQLKKAFMFGDKNGFCRYNNLFGDENMTYEQYYNETYTK